MVTVRLEVDIYPTEDEEKVEKAIRNIFPNIILSYEEKNDYGRLRGSGEGKGTLETLRMLIRSRRHKTGNIIEFLLNKQAASAGKVSFCESELETPLGAIKVVIEGNDSDELIKWLTE